MNYKRKLFRILGFGLPILRLIYSQTTILAIVGILLIASLAFDIMRLRNKRLNALVFSKLTILKEKEKKRLSGATWFLAGAFLAFLIFPEGIAVLAVAFAVVGDTAAEIIGRRYHKIRIGKTSLEGNLACLAACMAIGYIFLPFIFVDAGIMIAGSIAATIGQMLPLKADDNFNMQIIAGFVMFILG